MSQSRMVYQYKIDLEKNLSRRTDRSRKFKRPLMVAFLRSKILIEELQRSNTVDVVEIFVEVVVFAQPVIDKSWQFTQLVDIDYRIDVVKKR